MGLIVLLFIICVGGCFLVFRSIGRALFPTRKENGFTFIDNSVHHHHHHHDHKSIHIIDDATRQTILELKNK